MLLDAATRLELTGRATRRGQIRWLRDNGIPYVINAKGWPVVAEQAVLDKLAPRARPRQDAAPRLGAVIRRGKAA